MRLLPLDCAGALEGILRTIFCVAVALEGVQRASATKARMLTAYVLGRGGAQSCFIVLGLECKVA